MVHHSSDEPGGGGAGPGQTAEPTTGGNPTKALVGVGLVEVERGLGAAAGGSLDLHWGISPPRERNERSGCPRSRDEHRLISDSGAVVRVRCKGPNLCLYCRKIATIETVEMLTLDAMEDAPTIGVVLTAREFLTRRDCYAHLDHLRRAVRRRWPLAEWFVQVEFQVRGALHLNLLVKHVPADGVDGFRALVRQVWCARVDALPDHQWAEAFAEHLGGAQGFIKYVNKIMAHGLKESQAPLLGWKGHRTSQTRGYFVRPASVMRLEAREALAVKRELWKAIRSLSADELVRELVALPDDVPLELTSLDRSRIVEDRLAAALERRARESWAFVTLHTIATESGWAELAGEMTRRDVEPPMLWAEVDDLVAERGARSAPSEASMLLGDQADVILSRAYGGEPWLAQTGDEERPERVAGRRETQAAPDDEPLRRAHVAGTEADCAVA